METCTFTWLLLNCTICRKEHQGCRDGSGDKTLVSSSRRLEFDSQNYGHRVVGLRTHWSSTEAEPAAEDQAKRLRVYQVCPACQGQFVLGLGPLGPI